MSHCNCVANTVFVDPTCGSPCGKLFSPCDPFDTIDNAYMAIEQYRENPKCAPVCKCKKKKNGNGGTVDLPGNGGGDEPPENPRNPKPRRPRRPKTPKKDNKNSCSSSSDDESRYFDDDSQGVQLGPLKQAVNTGGAFVIRLISTGQTYTLSLAQYRDLHITSDSVVGEVLDAANIPPTVIPAVAQSYLNVTFSNVCYIIFESVIASATQNAITAQADGLLEFLNTVCVDIKSGAPPVPSQLSQPNLAYTSNKYTRLIQKNGRIEHSLGPGSGNNLKAAPGTTLLVVFKIEPGATLLMNAQVEFDLPDAGHVFVENNGGIYKGVCPNFNTKEGFVVDNIGGIVKINNNLSDVDDSIITWNNPTNTDCFAIVRSNNTNVTIEESQIYINNPNFPIPAEPLGDLSKFIIFSPSLADNQNSSTALVINCEFRYMPNLEPPVAVISTLPLVTVSNTILSGILPQPQLPMSVTGINTDDDNSVTTIITTSNVPHYSIDNYASLLTNGSFFQIPSIIKYSYTHIKFDGTVFYIDAPSELRKLKILLPDDPTWNGRVFEYKRIDCNKCVKVTIKSSGCIDGVPPPKNCLRIHPHESYTIRNLKGNYFIFNYLRSKHCDKCHKCH